MIGLKKQLGIPSFAVLPPLGVQRNEGEQSKEAGQKEEEEKEREEGMKREGRETVQLRMCGKQCHISLIHL